MSLDTYPSTSDLMPPIAGGQVDDAVLSIMEGARARIERGHSVRRYIKGGSVCAAGAVFAEAGLTEMDISRTGLRAWQEVESRLSVSARMAMTLLDKAAMEMVPESESYGNWMGPLEWVNQSWVPEEYRKYSDDASYGTYDTRNRGLWTVDSHDWEEVVKAKILAIYDHAIAERMAAV